jgi:hypothetical protein
MGLVMEGFEREGRAPSDGEEQAGGGGKAVKLGLLGRFFRWVKNEFF